MQLPDLYLLRNGRRTFYKRIKDIDYVEGDGNCSKFYFIDGTCHTESGNIGLHRKRLAVKKRFQKIHRSFVVNLCAIKDLATDGKVMLKSGIKLVCTEKHLPGLLKRFSVL